MSTSFAKEAALIYRQLEASLPSEGLFTEKSWRFSPKPWQLEERWVRELEKVGYRLFQFYQACELLYRYSLQGKEPAWIVALLEQGKPEALVRLGREKALSGQLAEVMRPDLLWQGNGFKLCELDQIPGGIGLTAWLQQSYAALGYHVAGGSEGMVSGFESILSQGDIIVSEEAVMYRPEMAYLIRRLEVLASKVNEKKNQEEPLSAPGVQAGSLEKRWRLLNENFMGPWQKKVYRFFELFDLENIACAPRLWEELLAGRLDVTPPPKVILEEKLWMGLFWMPTLRGFWVRHLTERGVEQLQQLIPYTWILNPEPLPPQAVYPRLEINAWEELKRFSQKERDLVLKISGFDPRGWGSRSVVIGSDASREEWSAAVTQALAEFPNHPYILQVFEHAALMEHPYFVVEEGKVEEVMLQGRVRLTPYYFLPNSLPTGEKRSFQIAGALATICPADKKILHGMTEAIMTPLGVLDGL